MPKAIIAMSGGVDSSVAASIISEQGYDCMGVTMKLYENEDIIISEESSCCSKDDIEDARGVATRLNMPFWVVNFSDMFKEKVIDNFIACYENGLTPNPCIECNRCLKFERLFELMQELKYDYVVTGHYSRIRYNEQSGRYELLRAADRNKDQSYVLYSLTQDQLKHVMFPLGELSKNDIRALAKKNEFINADKPDSQDVCFVPDGKYADFIEHYTGKTYDTGYFTDIDGNILGEHKGIIHYTIGQRKGLGIPGQNPWYVVKIDTDKNQVILGNNSDLFTSSLEADRINLISVASIDSPMRVTAKVRYRQEAQPAVVSMLDNGRMKVVFDTPQRAITKGQSVVLYDDEVVVGGGIIIKTDDIE